MKTHTRGKKEKARKNNTLTPKKAFLYGAGVLAAGGAIYFTAKTLLKKKEESNTGGDDIDVNINVSQNSQPVKQIAPSRNDDFPLHNGSLGKRVFQLQEAVQKIIGETAMKQYTKIDGDFRNGTEDSLRAAKLPVVIDEATFNRLTGNASVPAESPFTTGSKLFTYAKAQNFEGVMAMLARLKDVSDYSAANKAFIAQQLLTVSRSIVTYLLDLSFKYNLEAKAAIRKEFLRMGLKSTASDPVNEDGKWSLSGFTRYRDIITLTDTYVIGKNRKRIPVNKRTILGEQTAIRNGMTFFKTIDGKEYAVPTAHVKYLNR